MSHPEATSPEVADACRRAGLPYTPNVRGEGINAAAVGRPPSMTADRVDRALADVERVGLDLARLYGPALPAPVLAGVESLRASWAYAKEEAWDAERRHDRLGHDVVRLQHRLAELEAERDRARDLAAHLEAELEALDVAAIRRVVLREAHDLVADLAPLPSVSEAAGRPDGAYVTGRRDERRAAIAAIDAALDDDAAARLTAVDVPLLGRVVVDPTLPEDVLELRGATSTRIRIGDVPPAGGGLADPIAEDPTALREGVACGCGDPDRPGVLHRPAPLLCTVGEPGGPS